MLLALFAQAVVLLAASLSTSVTTSSRALTQHPNNSVLEKQSK